MYIYIYIYIYISGNNTEKIWAHRFLAKPKRIAAGGPRRCLGESVGVKPPNNFGFCVYKTS